MNCIFCKIIKKELPAKVVFEDDDFIAFNDIYPKAQFHVLLVPKKHIDSVAMLEDSDQDLMGKMILLARNIAKSNNIKSYRLVLNSGKDAGQEVDHLHLHILGGNMLGPIA